MDTFAQKLVCGFCVKVMKLEEKVFFLCLLTLSRLMGVGFWVAGGCWLRVVCAGGWGEWLQKVEESERKWKIECAFESVEIRVFSPDVGAW